VQELKQIPLSNVFNRGEILYLQGASTGATLTELNEQTSNKARKRSNDLKWLADSFRNKDGNDVVVMPLVLIMLSPVYEIVAYQGEEAYPFLNLFTRLELPKPGPEDYNKVCGEIINMTNGLSPTFPVLKRRGYWKDSSGITQLTKRRLNLKKETIQFRRI
jgi:hypothetical protein